MTQPFEAATVTLIDGTTFCVCAPTGDITPGGNLGLYFRDTRVLSRWELTLDGRPVQTLSVQPVESYAARFIARRTSTDGSDDNSLLLCGSDSWATACARPSPSRTSPRKPRRSS